MNLGVKNTITYENSSGIRSLDSAGLKNSKTQSNTNNYDKNMLITVISNKGGVGKTSFAVVSAMFISQKMGKRTLLLELDSSPGDFGILFDIEKGKSMELAIRFPEKYGEFIKNIHRNLDVLKGVSSPLVAENIKKGSINKLMDCISKDYECIIVDTQTIINEPVLDVIKLSNIIFIISDCSLESIARVSSLFDILIRKFSVQECKIKLILNKKKFTDFLKIRDLAKIIEIPVYAFVKFDKKFNKYKLIFNRNNVSKGCFFKDISKIFSVEIGGFESIVKG